MASQSFFLLAPSTKATRLLAGGDAGIGNHQDVEVRRSLIGPPRAAAAQHALDSRVVAHAGVRLRQRGGDARGVQRQQQAALGPELVAAADGVRRKPFEGVRHFVSFHIQRRSRLRQGRLDAAVSRAGASAACPHTYIRMHACLMQVRSADPRKATHIISQSTSPYVTLRVVEGNCQGRRARTGASHSPSGPLRRYTPTPACAATRQRGNVSNSRGSGSCGRARTGGAPRRVAWGCRAAGRRSCRAKARGAWNAAHPHGHPHCHPRSALRAQPPRRPCARAPRRARPRAQPQARGAAEAAGASLRCARPQQRPSTDLFQVKAPHCRVRRAAIDPPARELAPTAVTRGTRPAAGAHLLRRRRHRPQTERCIDLRRRPSAAEAAWLLAARAARPRVERCEAGCTAEGSVALVEVSPSASALPRRHDSAVRR